MSIVNFTNATKADVELAIKESEVLRLIESEQGRLRFMSSAMQLLKNETLQKCTRESVIGCLLRSASLDLNLEPTLGEAWVVPRKSKRKVGNDWIEEHQAIFQVGYKGWQELAFRAGSVESFTFGEVFDKDEFDYMTGTGGYLRHKKTLNPNKGRVTCYYVLATLPSGRDIFEIVTPDEAEAMRMRSESQFIYNQQTRQKVFSPKPIEKSAWESYAQMVWRKPIKDICTKRIRRTVGIMQAMNFDNTVTNVMPGGEIIDIPSSEVYNDERENIENGVLHEDYEMQFEVCKTADEIKDVYSQMVRNAPHLKSEIANMATKIAIKKGFHKQ